MPIPMPTVVAKGPTALKLDQRYATPHGRWASLKALRTAFAAGQDGVHASQATGSLAKSERDHLRGHWFTQGSDHWMMLKPSWVRHPWFDSTVFLKYEPLQADLTHGARVLTAGLIQALECSLGLAGTGDEPPLQRDKTGVPIKVKGLDQVDTCALARDLPVEVYWVCGKLDGFEAQISWNEQKVTCFILTPQVAEAADVFKKTYTAAQFKLVKTTASHGMLVTTTKPGSKAKQIETIVLARAEGGVTPHPLPVRKAMPTPPTNAPRLPGGTP